MKYTIIVDSREQRAAQFPRTVKVFDPVSKTVVSVIIATKVQALPVGDYAIEGKESICIIERKASGNELYQNLMTPDLHRQAKCFAKLKGATKYPIILLEAPPSMWRTITPYCPRPEEMTAKFFYVLRSLGFELLWMPTGKAAQSRRDLGWLIAQTLIATLLKEQPQ